MCVANKIRLPLSRSSNYFQRLISFSFSCWCKNWAVIFRNAVVILRKLITSILSMPKGYMTNVSQRKKKKEQYKNIQKSMLHLIALISQYYCKSGNKNTIIMINKHIMWLECIYYHALSRGYHPRTVRREMYLLKVKIYHYMWHVVILLCFLLLSNSYNGEISACHDS